VKRSVLLILLLFGCAFGANAQPKPVLRARFLPSNRVAVGQPVRLQVEILVPNFFTGAPEFPPLEMDGAIVTLSEDRPEHFTDQVSGTTYAGIRRFYLIYTQQPGTFTTPVATVSVPYAAKPPETAVVKLSLPELTLSATLPAEAENLDYFLPTSRLTISQKWSSPPQDLKVGDSVSRTITVATEKTKAMLIPPIVFSAPAGVTIYTRSPSVDDQKDAVGEFKEGVRTERATYLFATPGDYVLPGMQIQWWNLSSQKLVTSKLAGTKIHVSANPAYVSEVPPEPEPNAPIRANSVPWRSELPVISWSLLVLSTFVGVGWLIWHSWPRLASRYRDFVCRRRDSEVGHWDTLKKAISSNDAPRSYAALLAWLGRLGVSLNAFQLQAHDPTLDQQLTILSQTLFQQQRLGWDGQALRACLSKHRRLNWASNRKPSSLPPLNPG